MKKLFVILLAFTACNTKTPEEKTAFNFLMYQTYKKEADSLKELLYKVNYHDASDFEYRINSSDTTDLVFKNDINERLLADSINGHFYEALNKSFLMTKYFQKMFLSQVFYIDQHTRDSLLHIYRQICTPVIVDTTVGYHDASKR